ncbi:MAG: hypothetical protein A2Z29_03150 [Chloroflexi bacterium RBG_16_56_11]|nr:MAG: hypothetical protein A2Z29_03150 [Chloroflexi bacterium RBG_16_56_11]
MVVKTIFRPRNFFVLVALGIITVLGLSFGINVIAPRLQSDVPARLGDMELSGVVRGADAVTQVNRLHGLDVRLSDAVIASYAHSSPYHGDSHATIWMGWAGDAGTAATLVDRMVESINKGDSPFSNLRRISVGQSKVFQLDGPGGQNFFYQSEKRDEAVIWASIEAGDVSIALEQVVKNF